MSLLCCGLGLLPIWVWNAQHAWAGGYQLADRVGLSSRSTMGQRLACHQLSRGRSRCTRRDLVGRGGRLPRAAGCASSFAQTELQLPRTKSEPTTSQDHTADISICSASGAVLWCACLVASLLGETEVNWMAPGYLSVVVLVAGRVDQIRLQAVVGGPVPSLRGGVSRSRR